MDFLILYSLAFTAECHVRNQSLLAVYGTVTRVLIEPRAAVWGSAKKLFLKPEEGQGCRM